MTTNEMPKFSKRLQDEINFLRLEIDYGEGEEMTLREALRRLGEDMDDREMIAYEFRQELRRYFIEIGVFEPITDAQLARRFVSKGRKYDFALKGVKYVFTNWDNLPQEYPG